MLNLLISTGTELAWLIGISLAVLAPFLAYRRTRRVVISLIRVAIRKSPKWLAPVLAVCAFIPGPLDEALVLIVATVPILRSAHNRKTFARTARYAWSTS